MPAKRTMRFLATRSGTRLLCAARSWCLVGFQGMGKARFMIRSQPHFGRHEFGRVCAELTGHSAYAVRALVENVAGAALVQALETWSRRAGRPGRPALPP